MTHTMILFFIAQLATPFPVDFVNKVVEFFTFCFLVKWLTTFNVFSAIFQDYMHMFPFHVKKNVTLVVKGLKALGTLQSSIVFLLNKRTVKFTFRFVIV